MMKRDLLELLMESGLSEDAYSFSTTLTVADLLWDADLTRTEVTELPLAVIVDSQRNQHRIVLQRIRNEIRYCLYTDRDPRTADRVDYEIGSVENARRMVELVVELMSLDIRPSELSTPRVRK
ncbi:MAG: hypothetical protein H0T42_14885 [Deltaproteobacteria bacterium]|nr:hypothetical protein [Deltaproteobacteria bacterium]